MWNSIQDFHGISITQKKILFSLKNGLGVKEETVKMLHLEHSFEWWLNLDTAESRSELFRKFCSVVLEKAGEEDLGKCVKTKKIQTVKEERNIICFFILSVEWKSKAN